MLEKYFRNVREQNIGDKLRWHKISLNDNSGSDVVQGRASQGQLKSFFEKLYLFKLQRYCNLWNIKNLYN